MKLKKLAIGIAAAIAAFLFGISAYATVGFALSLMPAQTVRSEISEETIPRIEPAPVAPVPTEPIFVGPSTEEKTVGEPSLVAEFDPAGSYYLDEETLPKAFADIDHLEIDTHNYTDPDGNPIYSLIPPTGSILTKKVLKFDRIAVGGKEIAFQTATVDGVSYRFTGRFLNQAYCETDGDTPDLKGRLIKIKGNKWAAEMQAEFFLSCGC